MNGNPNNNMFFFGGMPGMNGIPGMNGMMPDINAIIQQSQQQANSAF
jgi:hypothetical protein